MSWVSRSSVSNLLGITLLTVLKFWMSPASFERGCVEDLLPLWFVTGLSYGTLHAMGNHLNAQLCSVERAAVIIIGLILPGELGRVCADENDPDIRESSAGHLASLDREEYISYIKIPRV